VIFAIAIAYGAAATPSYRGVPVDISWVEFNLAVPVSWILVRRTIRERRRLDGSFLAAVSASLLAAITLWYFIERPSHQRSRDMFAAKTDLRTATHSATTAIMEAPASSLFNER
jgi:peptidoglycan/LPS O-acetylase OafA/YrhL